MFDQSVSVLGILLLSTLAEPLFSDYAPFFLLLVYWAYHVIPPCSGGQATLGQRLGGLKTTTAAGARIGLGRASLRLAVKLFSCLLLGLPFIAAISSSRRQALHDMIAGTVVVRRTAGPESIANEEGLLPPRMP
jgi:uncharacterized RDD family membrane protein YckC